MFQKIFIFSLILASSLIINVSVEAGSSDNVSGYAWSDTIGWVSFNCTDEGDCGASNYGVDVDITNGKLSGYAWSDNVGWISFNRAETGAPPSNDPCSDGTCIAKVDQPSKLGIQSVDVLGWGRALTACKDSLWDIVNKRCTGAGAGDKSGGWDGWIRFDHNNPPNKSKNVSIDSSGNFHNWAWGSDVVGWLSFNSSDPGAGGAAHKVILDLSGINRPPNKPITDSNEAWNNCSVKELSSPIFSWNAFSDPDPGDTYAGYEVWVDDDSDFIFPYFNNAVNNSSLAYALNLTDDDDSDWLTSLVWGATYYWKVKVKDNNGVWSEFSDPNPFTMPNHAFPWVRFSVSPKPVAKAIVSFTDQSKCYFPEYDCKNNSSNSYLWNFGNGNTSTGRGNSTTTYPDRGLRTVTLSVTDNVGTCNFSQLVPVGTTLHEWWEVFPSSFLRKFLAFVSFPLPFLSFLAF